MVGVWGCLLFVSRVIIGWVVVVVGIGIIVWLNGGSGIVGIGIGWSIVLV